MTDDEQTEIGSLIKDIDWWLSKNKNGKGSPAKLNEKYHTDNDAVDPWNRGLNWDSKELPTKTNKSNKRRDQSTSPDHWKV